MLEPDGIRKRRKDGVFLTPSNKYKRSFRALSLI